MNKMLFGFVVVLLLGACSSSETSEKAVELPVLNLEKAISVKSGKSIQKQLIVGKIIPLETTEKSLFAVVRKVVKTKDYFFILDTKGKLKVFDTKGKFVRGIGREGQGPGEYANLADFGIDAKNKQVYINAVQKNIVYDFEGDFLREFSLDNPNLQVFTICNEKLFFIAPNKRPKMPTSVDLIYVFDLNGKLKKKFPAKNVRKEGSFSVFNNIATDGKSVFYKEEGGQVVYEIKPNDNLDGLCLLDLGKYAFKQSDFSFSKKKIWQERYRLQNILPAKDFMIFILQKGLVDETFEPFIWFKNEQKIQRFDYKVTYNDQQYTVLPYTISEGKIIGVLVPQRDTNSEEENPIFVVLRMV